MDQPPQDVSSAPDAGRPRNARLPAGWLSQAWTQLQQLAPDTALAPHRHSSLDIPAWLALAEARGATPLAGPLRHDLLLRSGAPHDGLARCGLNVFSRNRLQDDQALQLVRAQALRWGCLPACEALLCTLPKGLRYHAGFVCGPNGDTIKLYLAADEQGRENEREQADEQSPKNERGLADEQGPENERGLADEQSRESQHGREGAVRRAMAVLGLERPDEVFALGIDLQPSGWGRARSYQPWLGQPATDTCRWSAAEPWTALSAEGVTHRVLAQLDAEQANDGMAKRSYDIIFTPDATLAGLFEVTAAITALDSACRPHLAQERLLQADQRLQSIGLTLRPAAYEVDVFADGRRATDTLLTIGARASNNSERRSYAESRH